MSEQRRSLTELVAACREETDRFLRHESITGTECYEVFQRAIVGRDEAAWAAVFSQYRPLVLAWVRLHPVSATLREDEDYWTNRAFERFWAAITPDRFDNFATLAALLRYFKMCVHSVLIDVARAERSAYRDVLPEVVPEAKGDNAVERSLDRMNARDLWTTIVTEIDDASEQRLAYLCLVLDLKPREIHERFPQEYPSVADVYRIKRNLLDRLRRSSAVRAFLG